MLIKGDHISDIQERRVCRRALCGVFCDRFFEAHGSHSSSGPEYLSRFSGSGAVGLYQFADAENITHPAARHENTVSVNSLGLIV
jgi:hypothetical protein